MPCRAVPCSTVLYCTVLLSPQRDHFLYISRVTQIQSNGKDLNSPFWKDLEPSILPLHRAVSGMHFHSSEKLLIAAIDALVSLGANPGAVDRMGNSALHKAISVCTSRYDDIFIDAVDRFVLCTVLYCTVLYCTVLYSAAYCCSTYYCTIK